jgi:hypothetical protein
MLPRELPISDEGHEAASRIAGLLAPGAPMEVRREKAREWSLSIIRAFLAAEGFEVEPFIEWDTTAEQPPIRRDLYRLVSARKPAPLLYRGW